MSIVLGLTSCLMAKHEKTYVLCLLSLSALNVVRVYESMCVDKKERISIQSHSLVKLSHSMCAQQTVFFSLCTLATEREKDERS